jgi:hypothetical protein
MKELQNYEFLNPDAQRRFQELTEQLRQAMTNQFFKTSRRWSSRCPRATSSA